MHDNTQTENKANSDAHHQLLSIQQIKQLNLTD